MLREDVGKLLKHIYERQELHGPETSFKFRIVIDHNKEQLPACYPLPNSRPEKQSPKKPRQKKGKGAKKKPVEQLDKLLQMPTGTPARDDPIRPSSPIADSDPGPARHILGMTSPAVAEPIQHVIQASPDDDDFVEIDMLQQVKLASRGIQIWPSIHGPSRGQPKYRVLHSSLALLQESCTGAAPHPLPHPAIDPALLAMDSDTAAANGMPFGLQSGGAAPVSVPQPCPRPRPCTGGTQATVIAPCPLTDKGQSAACAATTTSAALHRPDTGANAPTIIVPHNSYSAHHPDNDGAVTAGPKSSTSARPTDLGRRIDSDQLALLEAQKFITSGKRSRRVTRQD